LETAAVAPTCASRSKRAKELIEPPPPLPDGLWDAELLKGWLMTLEAAVVEAALDGDAEVGELLEPAANNANP
jgi:hypothetical protein